MLRSWEIIRRLRDRFDLPCRNNEVEMSQLESKVKQPKVGIDLFALDVIVFEAVRFIRTKIFPQTRMWQKGL